MCLVGASGGVYWLLVGHMALIPPFNNAGSLASSLLDPSVCLVGASGGVYSLLAGHMAHLLLNYSAVQFGPARIIALIAVASLEVSPNSIFKLIYTPRFS